MLKRVLLVLVCLTPQVALAGSAGHRWRHHARTERRVPEPGILIGPVVQCHRTNLLLASHFRCDTGVNSFDPFETAGW